MNVGFVSSSSQIAKSVHVNAMISASSNRIFACHVSVSVCVCMYAFVSIYLSPLLNLTHNSLDINRNCPENISIKIKVRLQMYHILFAKKMPILIHCICIVSLLLDAYHSIHIYTHCIIVVYSIGNSGSNRSALHCLHTIIFIHYFSCHIKSCYYYISILFILLLFVRNHCYYSIIRGTNN